MNETRCPNCERLEARIRELEAQIAALLKRLQELEGRQAKTSHTSNQPPSQDKPWQPKSERQKTGRSSGAQPDHPGTTLKMSAHPDHTVHLPVTGHCTCGQVWDDVPVDTQVARQVHDLPVWQLQVTEYRADVKICPGCHYRQRAPFPTHVTGQVQYGPRVHALTVYLNVAHFVPLERTSEILQALCGVRPSDGTIALNLNLAADRLHDFEAYLRTALTQQPVLHADETGSPVNGKLQWMHVVSCAQLTFYGQHARRGRAALEDMKILPKYEGILVHDAWSSYFKLPAQPTLCGAHLLRELRGLAEHHAQVWAGTLRESLRMVYHDLKAGTLSPEARTAFERRFDELLEEGLLANPAAPPVPGRRGPTKQSHGRNLALRCQQHRAAVLLFLHDRRVPFDNNQAERDVRSWCVKRKVSGGFRSEEGGRNFARIRSYISTLQKQGLSVWEGLVSVFTGDVLMPNFNP
ncbi:IS66 family transposase [Deinococcus aquaticus]|uniref:IS66 family transposase n=1 Tax=Deinococcus aquaticus TaxID=328692 RepID=UPI003F459D26